MDGLSIAILVFMIVAFLAAAGYMIFGKKSGGCTGNCMFCSGCPSGKQSKKSGDKSEKTDREEGTENNTEHKEEK